MQKGASRRAAQKKTALSWWCIFGKITLTEHILQTADEHRLRPFSHRAGVRGRGKSLRLERALCDFGIEHSFEKASQRLREHHGVALDASAARAATCKHAARAAQKLAAQYARSHRELPAGQSPTIIAEADGSMLCTVPEGRARRGPRPRAWEEIRLVAAVRQGSVETKYAATFGSVQETGNRWGHVAKEAGRGLHSPIHPVCDGAEWIALQIREVFGTDVRALTDFYHVSEYLAAAAPCCRPQAPQAWRRTQQKRLKSGAAQKVIATLGEHREPAEVAGENAPVRTAHRYLSNRADTLDYAAALKAGLPIGSGLIESGHKHVLQARLKLPGAAWCKTNAQTMAQLRVLRSNHRWSELWPLAA